MKITPIPEHGIQGETALREAATSEYRTIIQLVRAALAKKINPAAENPWVDIQAIYADRVVVRGDDDGRLFSYAYTLNDANQVELGEAEEVIQGFQPVAMREARGVFLEARDEKGLRWRIRVIEAGLSGNRNFYPDDVLREAVPLFNGARVFVKSDEEHLKGKGKSFRNLIGRLSNAVFVEGKRRDTGQIQADLELLATADDVPAKLLEAWNRNMADDLFGFSIDANGSAKLQRGRRVARKINKVNSVDLIIEPGAGGQIINLIEALDPKGDGDMKLRKRMIETIKKAHDGNLPDGLDENDDEAVEAAYREALQQELASEGGEGGGAHNSAATGITRDELKEELRMVEAKSYARAAIAESNLPDAAKAKLRKQFDGLDRFTEAQVDEAIKDEREYLATFTESGHVVDTGGNSNIQPGESRAEKVAAMLDAFFDPQNREVVSFKECYIEITGDRRITGMLRNVDQARFRESLSDTGNLDVVLGDAIHRRLLAEYNNMSQYDIWRRLTGNPVPLSDFRTRHGTRLGGYGDLPTVDKGAPYGALTSPGDEEYTYSPAKRGGTETIALEDIRNDDVGLIQRIPVKLARAAKRTLAKFVLDFLRTNPTIYDGVAFFHANHNNLGSNALDATNLAAGRLAMLQQTEPGSNDRLGIPAVNLWVPTDLEETAFNLFRRTTNNDTNFVESLQMNVIPVWYWTDANDWVITADPMDIPIIELGFLDGNEEPELFVQDSPTSGSMFSNDQLTWKMRFIFGGSVAEYRGAYKAVVA